MLDSQKLVASGAGPVRSLRLLYSMAMISLHYIHSHIRYMLQAYNIYIIMKSVRAVKN